MSQPHTPRPGPATRRRFYWTAGLVLLLWLAAQLVLQLVAGRDGEAAFIARTVANVVQTGVVLTLAGWLLVSNTNRPSAIHPDDLLPRQDITPAGDPYALVTPEETARLTAANGDPLVLSINGRPIYGRRPGDDVAAIRMAIKRLEDPDAPLPADAPEWVRGLSVREKEDVDARA